MYIPDEVLLIIFSKLPFYNYAKLAQCSKQFNEILHDEYLWKNVCHKYSLKTSPLCSFHAICRQKLPTYFIIDDDESSMELPIFRSPRDVIQEYRMFKGTRNPLSKKKPRVCFKTISQPDANIGLWVGICRNKTPEHFKLDTMKLWNVLIHDNLIIVSETSDELNRRNIYFLYDSISCKIDLYFGTRLVYSLQVKENEKWYPIIAVEDNRYDLVQMRTISL